MDHRLKIKVFLKRTEFLKRNSFNSSYIFLLDVGFENLSVGLYVLYILNVHVQFHSNQLLFTIHQ